MPINRSFLTFCIIFLSVNWSFSQVNFFEGSLDELESEAKKNQKVYFIDFYTSWCGFCKKLDATTFRDEELGEYINQYFLAFKMDAETSEGRQITQQYDVKAYPTILVFDSKGNLLHKITGYKDAYGFRMALQPFESKSSSKNIDNSALSKYEAYIQNDYQTYKESIFNSSLDQFSPLKEKCIALGKNSHRFDFEELQIDTELQHGKELAKELNLYYYLGSDNIEKIKQEIDIQRNKKYVTNANLPFFILHFITTLQPDTDVLKWTNEFALQEKTKESLELKIYVQYLLEDFEDAQENFHKLKKQYYKKESNERIKALESITSK